MFLIDNKNQLFSDSNTMWSIVTQSIIVVYMSVDARAAFDIHSL